MRVSQILSLICLLSAWVASSQKYTPIAELKDNAIRFTVDTVAYKKMLSENLNIKDRKVSYDKIEITQGVTLGSKRKFYFLQMTAANSRIKVARWVELRNKIFYTNDNPEAEDPFEQIYLTCEGDGNCSPHVFEDKGMRMWGCSEIVGCNAKEGEEPKCITSQSLF